jgi:H+/Cl- antiporter ClcA
MRPDSPLRAALLATFEAASAAREAAGGARGLTAEGELELVRKTAEAAAAGAEREMASLARRIDVRTSTVLALAGLLLLGSGYALGRWHSTARTSGAGGASFFAAVAELNDVGALRRHCERTSYEQAGHRACDLPPVWIDRAR